MQLITINEAATVSGKSIQTIRRMIKHKKISVKRQKTPQGFNYLIVKESLSDFMNQATKVIHQDDSTIQETSREHRPLDASFQEVFKAELERFGMTMQQLIEQNQRDKENFFQLIKTFQDRIFSLESHIKMIEAPKKKWWKPW